jgi:cytochrome c556
MKAIVTISALLVCAAAGWQLAGQVSKGKTRPLQTKTWMKTVNGPHCSTAAKMLKAGPADDKEWADLVTHGQMLSESGFVLMADSRCPDKAWADASKQLQDGGAALATAAAAKNVDDARAALNNSVLASCKGCHSVHRAKK